MPETPPRSFRLSKEARELLEKLSEKMGLTHTSLIEMAIRYLAEKEGVRK